MRIKDFDFRFIHLRFFKVRKEAESAKLVFGYINKNTGIEFIILDEILDNGNFAKKRLENTVISYTDVFEYEIEPLKYEQVNEKDYENILKQIIDENKVNLKIKETRELDLIDFARDSSNPDIVSVHLISSKGVEPILVELVEILESKIVGKALMSALKSSVKKGDQVEFQVGNSGVRKLCVSYVK